MAATRWVDLDKVDTGDGLTPETAWNGAQVVPAGGYFDTLNDQLYTFKVKGSYTCALSAARNLGNYSPYSHVVEPWDATLYGPWRINFTGNYSVNWRLLNMKGGILHFYELHLNYDVYANGYWYNCFILCDATIGHPTWGILSKVWFYGCTISIGTSGTRRLLPSAYSSRSTYFYDCLIAGTDNGATSFIRDPAPVPVYFTKCAISTATLPTSSVATDCQSSWTKPTIPAWNAAQSSFDISLLTQNVDKPLPYTGTSPYTGYSTGLWGLSRYSIGAGWFVPPIAGTGVGFDFESDSVTGTGTGIEFESDNSPGTGVGVEFSVDL